MHVLLNRFSTAFLFIFSYSNTPDSPDSYAYQQYHMFLCDSFTTRIRLQGTLNYLLPCFCLSFKNWNIPTVVTVIKMTYPSSITPVPHRSDPVTILDWTWHRKGLSDILLHNIRVELSLNLSTRPLSAHSANGGLDGWKCPKTSWRKTLKCTSHYNS